MHEHVCMHTHAHTHTHTHTHTALEKNMSMVCANIWQHDHRRIPLKVFRPLHTYQGKKNQTQQETKEKLKPIETFCKIKHHICEWIMQLYQPKQIMPAPKITQVCTAGQNTSNINPFLAKELVLLIQFHPKWESPTSYRIQKHSLSTAWLLRSTHEQPEFEKDILKHLCCQWETLCRGHDDIKAGKGLTITVHCLQWPHPYPPPIHRLIPIPHLQTPAHSEQWGARQWNRPASDGRTSQRQALWGWWPGPSQESAIFLWSSHPRHWRWCCHCGDTTGCPVPHPYGQQPMGSQ